MSKEIALGIKEINLRADGTLNQYLSAELTASRMLGTVNSLRLKNGVLPHIFGRSIANTDITGILKAHRHARILLGGQELTVHDTYNILDSLERMALAPCRIDIGKLAIRWANYRKENFNGYIEHFLSRELLPALTGRSRILEKPQQVVLYGFGRIGRLLARILIDKTGRGDKLLLRGAVVRAPTIDSASDLKKRMALLRLDSVHGAAKCVTWTDQETRAIVANGNMIQLIYSDAPEKVDYTSFGLENVIVIDNTGKWRDQAGLSRHLEAKGVKQVVLTAPSKGAGIPNIVFGVNHHDLDPTTPIVSCASCTTNAIVPVLKVLDDRFGIESGHIETVHAYTNDQNLIDNYHKKERRGRAAPLNMVITETGAANAVGKVLPHLAGVLTGNAIRVPTPNVSMAILKLRLKNEVNVTAVNEWLRNASLNSPLQNQIDFTSTEDAVSCDFVGSRHAGIVDGRATIVNKNGRDIVVYVWYDNEFGYACQVMRVIQHLAEINMLELPL